ncbi:hypothetical protein SLE2022_151120 [Rubroshorea leprosula]
MSSSRLSTLVIVAHRVGFSHLVGLKNTLRMHIKKVNCSEWEQIAVPKRAIVALNLHNYGSGRNPWGNLKLEYLEKKGFVKAHADDGLWRMEKDAFMQMEGEPWKQPMQKEHSTFVVIKRVPFQSLMVRGE